jgi:hypothetical protein
MTMQHQIHPDDERLAALAGGDADVTADAGLVAHVSACDRCGRMVAELSELRSALAELPDLVPSRPLQLVPPAPEPRPARSGGWLRRLAGPMVAAGAGLVLVGAIGTSGITSNLNVGLGGAAAAPSEAAAPSARDLAQSPEPGLAFPFNLLFRREQRRLSYDSAATPPPDTVGEGSEASGGKGSQAPGTPVPGLVEGGETRYVVEVNPWGVLLLTGVLLFVVGGAVLVMQRGRAAS